MEFAVTKMSSKGQVVIPAEMRKGIHEGDKLVIIKSESQIILKKASKIDRNFEEDIEFARRTDEAFHRIQSGKGVEMEFEEFMDEIKKW
jgi:AbrB family looped-hinge helix DNA binding protein